MPGKLAAGIAAGALRLTKGGMNVLVNGRTWLAVATVLHCRVCLCFDCAVIYAGLGVPPSWGITGQGRGPSGYPCEIKNKQTNKQRMIRRINNRDAVTAE